jgi:hypothetical protein
MAEQPQTQALDFTFSEQQNWGVLATGQTGSNVENLQQSVVDQGGTTRSKSRKIVPVYENLVLDLQHACLAKCLLRRDIASPWTFWRQAWGNV